MTEKEQNAWMDWWKTVEPAKDPSEVDSSLFVFYANCDTMAGKARADLKKHQYRYLIPSQFGINARTVMWCWILSHQYKITPVLWPVGCLHDLYDDQNVYTGKCYNKVVENYFYYRYGQKMEDVRLEKVDSAFNNTRRDTLKKWFPAGLNSDY